MMEMRERIHFRLTAILLVISMLATMLSGCGNSSTHLEISYSENENTDISSWDSIDSSGVTTWDNASVVTWSDVDEFSDWVYSELLFADIAEEMPIVECRVLDYRDNGKYFDGEQVYRMVGDKFDVNSFLSKYAVGTGVIVICVVLNVVTAGVSTPITCFIAGAADASVSMAIKGAAFGAATKAIIQAIKTGDMEAALYGALEGSADGYMWGAIYGAATGGFKSKYCFTPETMVMSISGETMIANLSVGDLVYSYDETTNSFDFKPVTQLIRGDTTETVIIHFANDIVESTLNHPFLTSSGWYEAGRLQPGDSVFTASGEYQEVQLIERKNYDFPIEVITLCVDEYHSFLIGHEGLVVHNKCKPNEKYADSTYKFPEGSAQAAKYPKGIPFNSQGYPVFDQYATQTVKFPYPSLEGKQAGTCLIGNCSSDFRLANEAIGLTGATPPAGFTWHHCEDMMTMQLVPQDLHSVVYGGVAHAGGESLLADFWALLASAA